MYCDDASKGTFFSDRACTLHMGIVTPIYQENVSFNACRGYFPRNCVFNNFRSAKSLKTNLQLFYLLLLFHCFLYSYIYHYHYTHNVILRHIFNFSNIIKLVDRKYTFVLPKRFIPCDILIVQQKIKFSIRDIFCKCDQIQKSKSKNSFLVQCFTGGLVFPYDCYSILWTTV